jgi:hypothetical protein
LAQQDRLAQKIKRFQPNTPLRARKYNRLDKSETGETGDFRRSEFTRLAGPFPSHGLSNRYTTAKALHYPGLSCKRRPN